MLTSVNRLPATVTTAIHVSTVIIFKVPQTRLAMLVNTPAQNAVRIGMRVQNVYRGNTDRPVNLIVQFVA